MKARRACRPALVGAAAAAALLLGGCVAYSPYPAYGEAAVAYPAAPVVVAPPVSVGIGVGVGGYYGRPYYGRPYYGRPYYGRPGYWGRGHGGGRPYWR